MRIFATIALVIAAAPATNAAETFFAIYIAERNGVRPCYARTYDAKHLAAHPQQKVEHFFVIRSDGDQGKPPKTFDLSFGFRLKESSDSFSSLAGCAAKGDGATCSVEGDGGHFRLTPRPDGLLVTVVDYLAIEGTESFSPNLAESDDRAFRLYPAAATECSYGWGGDHPGGGTVLEPLTPSISRPE